MNYLSQQNPEMFQGKRVIVRVDFNVPVVNGIVSSLESFRIHAVLPTIDWLQKSGAKIILLSHIGRSGDSLQVVHQYIQKNLPLLSIQFVPEIIGDQVNQVVQNLESGQIVLLENVRMYQGEENNTDSFVQSLSELGDYFVNDAFAVSHRAHASVVGIAKQLPSFAGLLVEREIKHLQQVLDPKSPSLLIMAGIKFETKLPLIQKLLPYYDKVLLGGGLLNTYLQQLGKQIGISVVDTTADISSILGNPKIIIPERVIVECNNISVSVSLDEIGEQDRIVDVVIDHSVQEIIHQSSTVVWNGPLGWYEKGYTSSTIDIAQSLNEQTISIVGGGDTVTVLQTLQLSEKVTFLSTGGGAMLEYLQNGTIAGLQNLQ